MKKIIADVLAKCIDIFLKPFGVVVLPFGANWDGLGNRLKGICNFYARGYRKFFMIWSDDNWVPDRFASLFSLDGCRVVEINPGHSAYKLAKGIFRRYTPAGIVREGWPHWSFILPEEMCDETTKRTWPSRDLPPYSVDWRFDRTPSNVRVFFKGFFESLRPSQAVLKRVGGVQFKIQDCVCVQIRNNRNQNDRKNVCSVDSIIAEMRQCPGDTKFFVSYMDEYVWDDLLKNFAGRIFRLEGKDCSSMVDAVADMWLLGHGKALIASPTSTFSEVAWWWGGAQMPVTMLKAEFNQGSGKLS